jgi:hypothetical protein
MIETEDTIRKLDKDVALIKQKLDILENNHLAHIKKDVYHFVFTNFCGIGPIDLIRLNIHTGISELFDVKTDNDDHHRKRERTELQIKLGVKNLYVNLRKRTIRVDGKVEELQT